GREHHQRDQEEGREFLAEAEMREQRRQTETCGQAGDGAQPRRTGGRRGARRGGRTRRGRGGGARCLRRRGELALHAEAAATSETARLGFGNYHAESEHGCDQRDEKMLHGVYRSSVTPVRMPAWCGARLAACPPHGLKPRCSATTPPVMLK